MAQPRSHVSTVIVELSDESANIESIAMMNYAEKIWLFLEYLAILAIHHVFMLRICKSLLQDRRINNRIAYTIFHRPGKSCLFLIKYKSSFVNISENVGYKFDGQSISTTLRAEILAFDWSVASFVELIFVIRQFI